MSDPSSANSRDPASPPSPSPSSSLRRKPPPPPLQRSASFSSQISSENGSPLVAVETYSPPESCCSSCGDRLVDNLDYESSSMNMDKENDMAGSTNATAGSSRSVTFDEAPATTPVPSASTSRPSLMTNHSGRARSSSRQRDDSASVVGVGSGAAHIAGPTAGPSGTNGSGRSPNIPLPSPSAVHINQSLEESLRRAEEERQRRSSERRQLRRRRKQGSGRGSTTPGKERATFIEEEPEREKEATAESDEEDSAVEEGGLNEEDGSGSAFDEDDGEYLDSELEDENGRSLTRQLAETAVSVREMSRELGRARVKSTIQSVLIVTKARDNQLIKLTRELALYLMKTPRYGRNKGLIVYVDAQLKKSKRFDAAGIERDNPELFRTSSSHHHHHHHHTHTREGSSSSTHGHVRRNSTRRPSSTSASSINLLGMTSASSANNASSASTSALSSSTNTGFSGTSTTTNSGTSTPALPSSTSLANGRPLTKLTEALVNRQLERENLRRQNSTSGYNSSSTANGGRDENHASGTGVQTPMSPNSHGSNGAREKDSDDQQGQLRYWTAEMCSKSPHLFDLVVTLGGDGTVLFTSWLFQHVVPPVIPFALGSLGFLTNFDFSNYRRVMDTAINDGVRVNLRMRFTATIYRAVEEGEETEEGGYSRRRVVRSGETGQIFMEKLRSGGWDAIEAAPGSNSTTGGQGKGHRDRELRCSVTRPVESFEVLNDLVVDRGPSPYVSLLELFGDEHHMTTVQADGLCVATPTGSTAYSLSAGGSLVHPEIPTLLITPICPHTLSFRPMLLPDSMELRICVPYNSRSTAWASFDGRGRVELKQGDHIKVTASQYPFPTVCADKQSTDWFQAITRTLKWNERQRQKSFVVVEHDRQQPQNTAASKEIAEKGFAANVNTGEKVTSPKGNSAGAGQEEEEDDGTFDIDDIPVGSGTVSPDTSAAAAKTGTSQQPSIEAHNERQFSPPVIHPPSSAASINTSSSSSSPPEQQQQLREKSYSQADHSDPHLREYSTSPNDSNGRARSPRERTPRSLEHGLLDPSGGLNSARTPRASQTRHRTGNHSTSPRPVGSSRHTQGDKVKAFVVFGADSSDNDTSASEDGY